MLASKKRESFAETRAPALAMAKWPRLNTSAKPLSSVPTFCTCFSKAEPCPVVSLLGVGWPTSAHRSRKCS